MTQTDMIKKEYFHIMMAWFDSWNGYWRIWEILLQIHCKTFKNRFGWQFIWAKLKTWLKCKGQIVLEWSLTRIYLSRSIMMVAVKFLELYIYIFMLSYIWILFFMLRHIILLNSHSPWHVYFIHICTMRKLRHRQIKCLVVWLDSSLWLHLQGLLLRWLHKNVCSIISSDSKYPISI